MRQQAQEANEAAVRGPVAVVFGGQGSQRPGMGRPWRGVASWSRWEEAEEILGQPVTRLALEADEAELREPVNCQTALFVHQAVLHEEWARTAGWEVACVAGHSLGEYNALVAAGVLDFADGLRLVRARATLTAAAAAAAPGGMAACIGFDASHVQRAATACGAHVCNDNAPGQLVVAGAESALRLLTDLLTEGPGRVVRLNVAAAYHSPAMSSAVPPFRAALDAAALGEAHVPVVANVDARAHTRQEDWPLLLERQLVQAVRWRESVARFAALGAVGQVELSASPVLTGLAKRAAPGLHRWFVDSPEALAVAA